MTCTHGAPVWVQATAPTGEAVASVCTDGCILWHWRAQDVPAPVREGLHDASALASFWSALLTDAPDGPDAGPTH